MKSQDRHTVWCFVSGEAAGEIWTWSLLGVKGLKPGLKTNISGFLRLIWSTKPTLVLPGVPWGLNTHGKILGMNDLIAQNGCQQYQRNSWGFGMRFFFLLIKEYHFWAIVNIQLRSVSKYIPLKKSRGTEIRAFSVVGRDPSISTSLEAALVSYP